MPAPMSAPQKTVSSPAPRTFRILRYSAGPEVAGEIGEDAEGAAGHDDGPIARPSSPSVRFTAFEAPTTISTANRIHDQPRSSSQPLKNGTEQLAVSPRRHGVEVRRSSASASTSWAPNFTRILSGRRVRIFIQSSQVPIAPSAIVTRIATHT